MTTDQGFRYQLPSGESITLDTVLARAGEGTVYGVDDRPDWAAKVFHADLDGLSRKLDKVAAMIASPPRGIRQPNGFVVLTWPTHLLLGNGRPVGFIMPRINTATAVELHTMSNPTDRANPPHSTPQWTRRATWQHLVNTAANLCLAVEVVHRVNAVIGDFQERNILVADTTEVTLVDCDSMQFIDRAGHQYLCAVGRPEFTAPELVGIDLRVRPRARESDLFALAVHIHQLLMAGNHPFLRGDWIAVGEKPDPLTLARQGMWAGRVDSALRTHPLAPQLSSLPAEIQGLFGRAFTEGAVEPDRRPSAGEWRNALLRIETTTCSRGRHQYPAEALRCPWCAIDDERDARRRVTGAQPVVAPAQHGNAPPRSNPPAKPGFTANPKLIIGSLLVFVLIVVALTTFIVWGILSGASTFGS